MSQPFRACDFCGAPADLDFREIVGWEQLRDQGGANKIIARKDTGRRACRGCVERLKRGVALGQGALL